MADEVSYKVAEDFKAKVKLFSGKEVEVDLMKATSKEWKTLLSTDTTQDKEYEIIARVSGMSIEELESIPYPDYRLIADAFLRLGSQPLTNPT